MADLYSRLGRPDKARAMLVDYQRLPVAKTEAGIRNVHYILGGALRAEKKYADAVREFRASGSRGCAECQTSDVAYTFDVAGLPDSALVEYTRFLKAPGMPVFQFAPWLALAEKRSAEILDSKGKTAEALLHYQNFIQLWKNADAALQPQVQKARERVKELQRRTG
jgi:hypothetical protein